MLTLQVSQSSLADGRHRVLLRLNGGSPVPEEAVSEFRLDIGDADREQLRWYLEDFLEYPLDPAPTIAAGVEARLAELGTRLFEAVFAGRDAQDLWATLRRNLPVTRVEVASEVAEAATLPWELLRDPKTDTAVALQAASFVRVNVRPATPVRPPGGNGSRLRVLLVICRPDRGIDVPFRSVSRHLVRLGGSAPELVEVDVLRPPTFKALTRWLEAAAGAGTPYQVVHFDGHGTYLDLNAENGDGNGGGHGGFSPHRFQKWSRVSAVRPGTHGYLVFEDPDTVNNRQYVDGPALGALLARTGVAVLVLNACRSAYAEAPTAPQPDTADADVHGRVRAYGSLALEVTDAGVPGVVAMRYSVYVVTAAQFVADLYEHLLAGQPLGAAVSAGRRQLAAQPMRTIAFEPRPLQDWSVPVVYEAAPVPLFAPSTHGQVTIRVTEPGTADTAVGLPARPDVGFFGRDETLLAVDRAFDGHRIVLLHAFAGSGKTSTAVEFADWYRSTGGLAHPQLGDGPVLFSSLEQHKPLAVLLNEFADVFDPLLKAKGIAWQALDDRQRRQVAVQVLAQVPVLWIWDNVEPVAGFPKGTPSAWTAAEQAELVSFLRELAAGTRARVLLTSRRDEQAWLGDLPARVGLPGMPMREAIQLTQALAERHGHKITDVLDWRPLLRYASGNPLAITVLVGQALRERLTRAEQIEGFVAKLRAGEADLEDDVRQGRSASLGASLGYGFAHAFDDAERARLAVLHLFQETVDVDALVAMGDPDQAASVPQLHGLTREAGIELLDRAAEIGLLTDLGSGYYRIHPALPWYFGQLFTTTYGPAGQPVAIGVANAYTRAISELGNFYHARYVAGHHDVIDALGVEEANLLHARALARRHHRWDEVIGCMQGLRNLYAHTGRRAHWARLVGELGPDLVDPATDQPLPGRAGGWSIFIGYRVDIAREARDWSGAQRLQTARVVWNRQRAADALDKSPDELTSTDRNRIRNLATSLDALGHIQREQRQPDCVASYQEAAELCRRTNARTDESVIAFNLGHSYLHVPELRNLDEAERWYRRALDLTEEHDHIRRAQDIGQLGRVAYQRFIDGRGANAPADVLVGHLNDAVKAYTQALDLTPADNVTDLAILHNQLGNIYTNAGRLDTGLDHYQRSVRYTEDAGDRYGAGQTRFNIALTLARTGRFDQALLYARAALRDFEPYGASAADQIEKSGSLITLLEGMDQDPPA